MRTNRADGIACINLCFQDTGNCNCSHVYLLDNSSYFLRIAARDGISPSQSDGGRLTFLPSKGTADVSTKQRRRLQSGGDEQERCDSAFLNCMPHAKCITCFATMQADDVDWASVPANTPCPDVIKFLSAKGKCTDLQNDQAERDVFCNTFDSCVIWEDEDDDPDDGEGDGDETQPDCDALTECDWPGKHPSFLGNGVCDDALPGCYNSAICNYDGGDCCEDTCKQQMAGEGQYVVCGQDGYACRDPDSDKCDPNLTVKCKDEPEPEPQPQPSDVKCGTDETVYRLIQYDSWGDGWDATTMSIKDVSNKVVYEGGLKEGSEGTELICLKNTPSCYSVEVKGGIWGNEVSWEIKALTIGAPSIADGGTPMDCTFSSAGEACEKTCDGPPTSGHENDPKYKSYNDLLGCIKEKCIIQIGACEQEETCSPCLLDDTPAFCFANMQYNALIDCALCRCSADDEKPTEYCESKLPSGGGGVPPQPPKKDEHGVTKQCNADETLKGSAAVMKFSQCSEVDTIKAMVTDFDENNFGKLDAFEACAHSYANDNMHGGRKALDCMRILSDTIKAPESEANPDAPTEAIAALANHLYSNAETFCACASDASKDCPMCASFIHFKVLLAETLDACKALDEIDCDAWNEFYDPCKKNLLEKFSRIDFDNQNQCDFVKDSCGNAGPFPAFRRLDCGREVPKESWDFYTMYDRGCLGGAMPPSPSPPRPGPSPHDPAPQPSPAPVAPAPKPSAPVPMPTSGGGKKPYVPPPDDSDNKPNYTPSNSSSSSSSTTKKSHKFAWFALICVIAGGLYYKKKQSDSFDFVQYRRQRNWGGQSEMYQGLSMDNSCSFEPPTLPPTPAAMGGTGMP